MVFFFFFFWRGGGQYPVTSHVYIFNLYLNPFNPYTSCKHTRELFFLNHIFISTFLNSIEFPWICTPSVKKQVFFNMIKG